MTTQPVILVTGASSGIGAASAKLFAARGYRVVLAARRKERLDALAEEIKQTGGNALAVPTDLSDHQQIDSLVQKTIQEYGQIDVLLNNAGFGHLNWLEELDPIKDIEMCVRVNVMAVIWMARAVLPHMIARRSGHIINMASMAGLVATPTYSLYAATKFAVRGFTEGLRREVRVLGIWVSAIYPGGVETEFSSHTGAERKTGVTTPKKLRLTADDVAESVWRMVRRPRRGMIIPPLMGAAVWLNTHFPALIDWLIENRFTKKERL